MLQDAFHAALDKHSVRPHVELAWQSCFGRCTQGPNVLVREILTAEPTLGSGFATLPGPRGTTALYNRIEPSRTERIVTQHVCEGQIIREFIERPGILTSEPVASTTAEQEKEK